MAITVKEKIEKVHEICNEELKGFFYANDITIVANMIVKADSLATGFVAASKFLDTITRPMDAFILDSICQNAIRIAYAKITKELSIE